MDRAVIIGLVVAVLGGGAYFFWRAKQTPPPAPAPVAQPVAPAAPPPAPPPPQPAIKHPVEAEPKPPQKLPSLAESDEYVKSALIDLIGRKGVLTFLYTQGFIQRFVATVDNLANERAATHLWPVNQTPGAFETEAAGGGSLIAARNAARYAPFVAMADGVDARAAARLYRRTYPLLQQAYEELGYPGKYFNDRMIEVIDHLLDTPEVAGPIKVRAVEVKDPSKPARPHRLYQFEDPALESRSAGQKILLRMGPENARKLRAKLSEFRGLIARG
jgi:hypothetical protein